MTNAPFSIRRIRVPEGADQRRNPFVIADIAIGEAVVAFSVSATTGKRRFRVRPPIAGDGTPGVGVPDEMAGALTDAAIAAALADDVAGPLLRRENRDSKRARSTSARAGDGNADTV